MAEGTATKPLCCCALVPNHVSHYPKVLVVHKPPQRPKCWQPNTLLVAHTLVLLGQMDWEDSRLFTKDLRIGLRDDRRHRKLKQKYSYYRGVQPSWPGQDVYKFVDRRRNAPTLEKPPWIFVAPFLTHPNELQVGVWTKQDQYKYRECNLWPGNCLRRRGRTGRRCSICVPTPWEHLRTTKVKHRLIQNGMDDAVDADVLELYSYDYTIDKLPNDVLLTSSEEITKPETAQGNDPSDESKACLGSPFVSQVCQEMPEGQGSASWVFINHEDQTQDLQEDWEIL